MSKMAKKAAAPSLSKSDAVKEYMSSNPNATAKEVVTNLKRAGIKVSLSLVAKLKSKGTKPSRPKASSTHAASNGSAETSKADRIRQVAQGMKKPVRPRDVIAALAAEGIAVSSAQVSTTLRAMGMRRRRRGSKPAEAAPGRPAMSASGSLSLDSLLAAKKLVVALGSVEAAKTAVDALAKLR
jgi:arginine repressor